MAKPTPGPIDECDPEEESDTGIAPTPGTRPTLPHGRAGDPAPRYPAQWRRSSPAPVNIQRYCRKCGIGLPLRDSGRCENCGANTHALSILPGGRA
jgi:hypothetical protein